MARISATSRDESKRFDPPRVPFGGRGLSAVVITFLPKQVSALIRDDGVGMDVEATEASVDRTRHFGLLTMRERADGDQGKLEIRSQLGKGTEVRATFDL